MSKPIIKDFDKVVKQQRIAILAGEEIDVSKIPSRVMIELINTLENIDPADPKNLMMVIGLVTNICQVSNKKITDDFLIDNTDLDTLLEFAEFVMEPIKQRATAKTEGQSEKN